MTIAHTQSCPKCGRNTLFTTKTLKFQQVDGETSLRMVLECSHCKRAIVQAAPEEPSASST